jgi:hypothetical protein
MSENRDTRRVWPSVLKELAPASSQRSPPLLFLSDFLTPCGCEQAVHPPLQCTEYHRNKLHRSISFGLVLLFCLAMSQALPPCCACCCPRTAFTEQQSPAQLLLSPSLTIRLQKTESTFSEDRYECFRRIA